jgi:putative FmdB family regulatory protein
MPIYEYRCRKCDEHFERIVKAGTPDCEISCKKCGQNDVMRKLSLFSHGTRSADGNYVSTKSSGSCGSCSSKHCGSCSH